MPGLTKQDVESVIVSCDYQKIGTKTTLCFLTLKNGFEVVATSSCVNAEDYDEAIGGQTAYQRALDKVWELQGYMTQWQKHWDSPGHVTPREEVQPAAA